jgi:hypothetical protein
MGSTSHSSRARPVVDGRGEISSRTICNDEREAENFNAKIRGFSHAWSC